MTCSARDRTYAHGRWAALSTGTGRGGQAGHLKAAVADHARQAREHKEPRADVVHVVLDRGGRRGADCSLGR
jgi:hypothetical protein